MGTALASAELDIRFYRTCVEEVVGPRLLSLHRTIKPQDAAQRAVETNWRNAAERLTQVIAQHGERGSWHSWEPTSD